jgi:hypothetical protein
MSFLYPRTVTVSRPQNQIGVGSMPYGGLVTTNETVVARGLPASIQMNKARGKTDANLPADAGKTVWHVFIPAAAAPLGQILVRDVLTDELGQRYQVVAPYWNSLGHTLTCERLEA